MFLMSTSLPFMLVVGTRPKMDSTLLKGLFKEGRLSIPQGSIRKLLVKESHEGGLMGHFGIDKSIVFLKEKFFWPYMKKMSIGIALGVWLF